jgi:type IV pilus assembly protein PilP
LACSAAVAQRHRSQDCSKTSPAPGWAAVSNSKIKLLPEVTQPFYIELPIQITVTGLPTTLRRSSVGLPVATDRHLARFRTAPASPDGGTEAAYEHPRQDIPLRQGRLDPDSFFALSVLLFGLSGCGSSDEFSDLDAYMNEVRLRPAGPIEPTPTFHSYPTFTYSAANLRSPFSRQVQSIWPGTSAARVTSNPTPTGSCLEGFNIEQFEMVGTISNASGSFALLRGAGGCIG